MNKLKKIFTFIIFALIVLFMNDKKVYAIGLGNLSGSAHIGETIPGISLWTFAEYSGLYCSEHSGPISKWERLTYEITDYIEIRRLKCYFI